MICLVALHVLLAAADLTKRGFFPSPLAHSAYSVVVDQARYLEGFIPLLTDLEDTHPGAKEFITGKRGPDVQWSDPRALWNALTQGWLRGLWRSDGYMSKLPLPFFLPAVVHKLSGGSILATALTPQLFLALLLLSVYGIGRRAGGPWIGLAAAVIASGYPGVYQLARTHHDVLATSAMAAAVICLILYSRGFTRLWICALAGIAAYISTLVSEGVSGSLLIGLIVAGPFAMEYVRLIGRCRSRTVDALWGMAGLALFLAPVCLLYNWNRIAQFILYGQSSWAEVTAHARVGSHVPGFLQGIVAFSAYFFEIAFEILQPMMTLWLVAGAVLLWRAPRGERLAVVLSVAVPLALLSVMPKKASLYIMPLCPGLALTTSVGLRGLKSPKLRRWAIGLAAACGLMMPLYFALVPPNYRHQMDLGQIAPLLKTTVKIAGLPLGVKKKGYYLSHRTEGLPLAMAGRELVAYDLQNNPRVVGPRRVAVFGPSIYLVEGFRYVVELAHPEMFVIDYLNPAIPPKVRWLLLDKLPTDQFDYLIFIGNDLEEDLHEFPSDDWDPLQMRRGSDPPLVVDEGDDGQRKLALTRWNARFRRFTKNLLQRRWKRVDLSVGPIYQAVDQGQGQFPPPRRPGSR